MSYWILEFIRVGIGYIFLMYLWPSVVFRKHLSGKSLTYRKNVSDPYPDKF